MKTKILNLLKEKGSGRSFVELSEIDGFTGNNNFEIEDKNIILWQNISPEAINAINELIEEKKNRNGFHLTFRLSRRRKDTHTPHREAVQEV